MPSLRIQIPLCLCALAVLALSACSKGPSVAEVQSALEESMFMSSRVAAAVIGQPVDEQVQVDRVDNCKARGSDSGYTCDVEYRVISRSGSMPTQSKVESIELMDRGDGWVVID